MIKKERLQKLLAAQGLGSRRTIEEWIKNGEVTVNGQVAKLGDQASASDTIRVGQKKIFFSERASHNTPRVLLYHKPSGEICTRDDPEGRPTIFERLPGGHRMRWVSVGRLDLMTSGLLLLTTDGDLAHRLMHPSFELEREYAVRVYGAVSAETLEKLQKGIHLEDGLARFLTIQDAGGEGQNHWYHVTLKEGRNREVRRLWEACGLTVSRLIRIRFAQIALPPWLKAGHFHELTLAEVNQLRQQVGLTEWSC